MRDTGFTSLSTERLVLRRFEQGDSEAFASYRADPDVARYQSWEGFTRSDAERFVAEMSRTDPGVPGEWFQFAVSERATGELVGDCALVLHAGDPPIGEVGYTLAPAEQGRGFATEAVRAVIGYAFEQLGAAAIRAVTDVRNEASIAVAERLGMRKIATVRATFKGAPCEEHTFETVTCACARPRV